jgi:hypothetical protein
MKKIATLVVTLLAAVSTYAQGTVNFANAGAGINAAVHIDTIGGALAGAGYMAQLLVDTGGGSFTAVGSAANFIGAGAPGYFNGGVITVGQVAPGANGTFQAFAWDSSTGVTTYAAALASWTAGLIHAGYSGAVTIATGGAGSPPSAPAGLTGLQPWTVTVPEPSTIALGVLGAAALLLRRRK